MSKFSFLKVYNSPFKPFLPKLYIGKIAVGVPIFYPRIWVPHSTKKGYLKAKPKLIGFDFVDLCWKWKFDSIRFEYNPVWSFVFFDYQIALVFAPPYDSYYWECWLGYKMAKGNSVKEKLETAKRQDPCVWTRYYKGVKKTTCYWDLILKKGYE